MKTKYTSKNKFLALLTGLCLLMAVDLASAQSRGPYSCEAEAVADRFATTERLRQEACDSAQRSAAACAINQCVDAGYQDTTCRNARHQPYIVNEGRPDPMHFDYYCKIRVEIRL